MRFMKYIGLMAVVVLAGCANFMDKPFQKVYVTTPGAVDVECILSTPHHQYSVVTPNHVMVENSENSLHIECNKGNYYPAVMNVESRVTLKHQPLNIFNGLIPGMAYDIASNAIYTYPKLIEIPMERDPYAMLSTAPVEDPPPAPLRRKGELDEEDTSETEPVPVTPADDSFNKSLRK